MTRLLLAMTLAALTNHAVAAAGPPAQTFRTGEQRVSLLELFTSEGCSSCPPAEEWLSRQKASQDLWKTFVPVAFHVDYWDYLGWRDPWASHAHTTRQQAYANAWRAESIYTPGFVLNGKERKGWGRFGGGLKPADGNAGVLEAVSTNGQKWEVHFTPAKQIPGKCTVHAALLD
ncbi:MAG TPA: DUF1223 domain-containing protein, partial [Verrucomicrobiae bacterium]|nr:DUF1223 domain-containing protein [Verrucomicrobiae bacterium]